MRRSALRFLLFVFLVALLFQQGYFSPALAEEPTEPFFEDVSRQTGLRHNRLGNEKAVGQAWGDYDGDGWVDLYVTDTQGPNTLYRNNGDGTFSVSGLSSQVALPGAESAGASFVDFDNDGWKDLYVVARGPNTLFWNHHGQGFIDITEHAGLTDPWDGKTASWGDFDQDGYLDLYIANWSCYPDCGRPMYGDSDRLYHNNGDGTFSDVTAYLGAYTMGAGFVASFTDYDNDGDLDIYLVNDQFIYGLGNVLWRNDGPGCAGWCFSVVSKEAGVNRTVMGMGLATGDYDNDGDIDFYFSNAGPMTLYRNLGDGSFENIAAAAGVESPNSVGWGTVFLDYDNDGWRDLYLAVAMSLDGRGLSGNQLFHNNADGSFSLVTCNSGAADPGAIIGVATADYNQDGWVDILIGDHIHGYRLLRNSGLAAAGHHWLAIELVGGGPVNRDAVGARVYVETTAGQRQLQEVVHGSSNGAGNELVLYFGLGEHATAQTVEVVWPDGLRQVFPDVPADRRYRLAYPVDEAMLELQRQVMSPVEPVVSGLPLDVVLLGLIPVAMLLAGWLWHTQQKRCRDISV
ncbi:MAG: CRTAC1 family protein [Anaerolineales bacterium]|nr:CRTAC1 family protein [Anaerolineales bacterium]